MQGYCPGKLSVCCCKVLLGLDMQAVASNSKSLVPAMSLNGLIRYRDDFKQRMDDLRIYRQLKREEDILQKYGTVPQQHAACCQNHSVQNPHDLI